MTLTLSSMTYDIENTGSSSSSSGCSTPRLHERRNAMAHILQGYSIADLEGVYNSTEDISTVLAPVPSPSKDGEDAAKSPAACGETPPAQDNRRMRKRRNAVCFENMSRLLASAALRRDSSVSGNCSDQ